MDPMTYLLLQKNGGLLGGSGSSSNSLLPLLLLGGGGLGGLGGGHGKFNPLLFSLLGGCKEQYTGGCVQPSEANNNADLICGIDTGTGCKTANQIPVPWKCLPCCTCPDTTSAPWICGIDTGTGCKTANQIPVPWKCLPCC